MEMSELEIQNIIFLKRRDTIIEEVEKIISLIDSDIDYAPLEEIFTDTVKLYNGEYPGYQACNTRYHDLDHTVMVFLATARLIHSLYLTGKSFKKNNIVLTLIGALLHDAGFIQTEDDKEGTGAKYTIGHETRSNQFVRRYFLTKGYREDDIIDCTHIIQCTILALSPKDIPFRTREIELLGKIVGTTDLLAQIADRIYLEKLLYLYEEFEEANVPGFDSELELLKKTENFYKVISKKRMEEDLGGVASFMHLHFKNRWGIDRDLYQEYIDKNIEYLRSVLEKYENNYRQMLKRGGITKSLQK